MAQQFLDLSPEPWQLQSLIEDRTMSLEKVLLELLDNSTSWGQANEVMIECDSGTLTITDNGRGCTDMERLLRQGAQPDDAEPGNISRYRIGLKKAVVWLGATCSIKTRSADVSASLNVNWEEIKRQKDWHILPGRQRPDAGPSFMQITVTDVYRNRMRALAGAIAQMAKKYTPALLRGLHIVCNGASINPIEFPELTDVIDGQGFFLNRKWHLHAGLMSGHSNWEPGYTVSFGPRILLEGSTEGTRDFSPRRFFGHVELFETSVNNRWKLDALKCGFEEEADLLESLFPYCEELLKKDHHTSEDFDLDLAAKEATEMLGLHMKKVRERRTPREHNGRRRPGLKPKPPGPAPHPPADTDDAGAAETADRITNIRIEWSNSLGKKIGDVKIDRAKQTVYLNQNHSEFKDRNRRVMVTHALYLLNQFFMEPQQQVLFKDLQESDGLPSLEKFAVRAALFFSRRLNHQEKRR